MRILPCLRWVTAALALLALLATGAVFADIYLDGTSAANMNPEGVYIVPIYERENVMSRLSSLAGVYAVFIALCVATGICHTIMPTKDKRTMSGGDRTCRTAAASCCTPQRSAIWRRAAQWTLLLAGLAFLVHGIFNGGLWDVLVKAINICTECIGLG